MGDNEFFLVSDHSLRDTAAVFRQVAATIHTAVDGAHDDLRVQPWLGHGEPVSAWAAKEFSQYFEQFLGRLTELGHQHQELASSMTQLRENYRATEAETTTDLNRH